jgi:hypothetical protein
MHDLDMLVYPCSVILSGSVVANCYLMFCAMVQGGLQIHIVLSV